LQTLALGFGVALAIIAASMTTATLALRTRMERT
jgi:hypothetical protein